MRDVLPFISIQTSRPHTLPPVFVDHLSPILDQLSELHNFTIESQIRFHAPLAFEPQAVANSHGNGEAHGLTPEDLTVFVNSAEWTLCEFNIYHTGSEACLSNEIRSIECVERPGASLCPLHALRQAQSTAYPRRQ